MYWKNNNATYFSWTEMNMFSNDVNKFHSFGLGKVKKRNPYVMLKVMEIEFELEMDWKYWLKNTEVSGVPVRCRMKMSDSLLQYETLFDG